MAGERLEWKHGLKHFNIHILQNLPSCEHIVVLCLPGGTLERACAQEGPQSLVFMCFMIKLFLSAMIEYTKWTKEQEVRERGNYGSRKKIKIKRNRVSFVMVLDG